MQPATYLAVIGHAPARQEDHSRTDLGPNFAAEASAERIRPGRGALYGLVLGGGAWAAIFALVSLFKK